MSYSEIKDQDTYQAALLLARGCYQRALLSGSEALSGATLRGRAKSYGARYAESRRNLLSRCRQAGLAISERRGSHGKRILVIGSAS